MKPKLNWKLLFFVVLLLNILVIADTFLSDEVYEFSPNFKIKRSDFNALMETTEGNPVQMCDTKTNECIKVFRLNG